MTHRIFRALVAGTLLVLATSQAVVGQTATVVYLEDDAQIANPDRGFYAHRQANSALGPPLTIDDLQALRRDNVTLVLRLYYLKSFRDSPLSQAQLNLIETDLNTVREAGSKVLLRFAYSSSSSEADAPLSTILTHVEQLRPLFDAHSDVISLVQAGFIGAWGEWYYSTNNLNNTDSRRELTFALLDALPASRMVQVRTPNYKRNILGPPQPPALTENEAFSGEPIARIAHHNDCFLASINDYGTYQNIAAEKVYLEAETRFLVMGGETCAVSPYSGCGNALDELERFKWTYLNQGYNPQVLDGWESEGCMEEVRQRLGYRFSLQEGRFDQRTELGRAFSIDLDLVNTGFAAPFNGRLAELILRHSATGDEFGVVLPEDPRFWLGGDSVSVRAVVGVPADLPTGEYRLFLNLPDDAPALRRRPEYSIRLANFETWETTTGYNDLQVSFIVENNTSGLSHDGSLWLQKLDEITGIEAEPRSDGGVMLRKPYPNPFESGTTVVVSPPQSQHVRITLYDAIGRHVELLHDGFIAGGTKHSVHMSGANLSSGVYFIQAIGDGIRETQIAVRVR